MEVNGIANMKIILEMAKEDKKIDESTIKDLQEQLDLMHAYMLEYAKAERNNTKRPYWHEVKERFYDEKN